MSALCGSHPSHSRIWRSQCGEHIRKGCCHYDDYGGSDQYISSPHFIHEVDGAEQSIRGIPFSFGIVVKEGQPDQSPSCEDLKIMDSFEHSVYQRVVR